MLLLCGIFDSNKELCCYSVDPSSIPPAGGQTTVETARLCHACAMRVNRYRRIPSPRQNLRRKTWPSGVSAIGCNPGTGAATCPPVAEPLCCPPWVAAILPETGQDGACPSRKPPIGTQIQLGMCTPSQMRPQPPALRPPKNNSNARTPRRPPPENRLLAQKDTAQSKAPPSGTTSVYR
mgnify:CR=1 FL=1